MPLYSAKELHKDDTQCSTCTLEVEISQKVQRLTVER
jgi:hypothetical protein